MGLEQKYLCFYWWTHSVHVFHDTKNDFKNIIFQWEFSAPSALTLCILADGLRYASSKPEKFKGVSYLYPYKKAFSSGIGIILTVTLCVISFYIFTRRCGGQHRHLTAKGSWFNSRLGPFCVEFACSPRVLRLPPTVQKHAC